MSYTIKIAHNGKEAGKIIMKQTIISNDGRLWSRLTEDEQKELLKIERDVQSEKDLIPNEQIQTKHKKWL